jgi:WD40 repeat protein
VTGRSGYQGEYPDIQIQLHDANTLAFRRKLTGHQGRVVSVAFSPDGERLASGDYSGGVKLWDTATGEELIELDGFAGGAGWLQVAPDGLSLVGTATGGFTIWHGQVHQSEAVKRAP